MLARIDAPPRTGNPGQSHHRDLTAFSQDDVQASIPTGADDLLALLVTIYPEVMRTCVLSIVSASIANAVAMQAPNIDPRGLIQFYPRESATLLLASQRILRWYAPSAFGIGMRTFESRLAAAKFATIRFAEQGFAAPSEADMVALCRSWCAAVAEALALVRTVSHLLDLYGLENEPDVLHQLEAAAGAIATGLWPVIDEQGLVKVPGWADQRGTQRVAFRIPARLRLGDRVRAVLIRDFSAIGLGLECRRGLPRGAQVTVEVGTSLKLDGRIAWSSGGRAGIVLSRPLHGSDPHLAFCARCGGQVTAGPE